MSVSSSDRTPQTLLARLRQSPDDVQAWTQFVARYGPVVLAWCRGKGFQPADAEDVTQEVFVDLCKQMRRFVYDPSRSFRKWLSRLTHHACVDFLERRRRSPISASDHAMQALLDEKRSADELASQMEGAAELEQVEEALKKVRLRIEPVTFEAFRLTALEELPAVDVAQQLKISVDSVYQAKCRVVKLLKEEVRHLDGESGNEDLS